MSGQSIHLPDVPPIAGLRFRLFDPQRDYPAMVHVLNRWWEADGIEESITLDLLKYGDVRAGGFDPARDRFVAEVGDEVIGVATTHATQNAQGERLYFHVFPLLHAWQRKGIGRVVLRYCEGRLRELAAAHPCDAPKFFQTYRVWDKQPGAIALLESEGYQPIRYMYDMVRPHLRDVPELPPPEGIEIRPLDRARLRQTWEAIREAFSDAWGYIPWPDEAFEGWAKNPYLRPELSRIAWSGEEVAGTTLIFIDDEQNRKRNRKRADTEVISVRKPWRRRGIARALLASALRAIRDAGMSDASLSVDTENVTGALRLYEQMGYAPDRRARIYRKPVYQ